MFLQALLGTSDLGLIGDSQWWLVQALAVAELAAGFPQYVDPNAHGGTNARNQRSSPSIVQKEPAITRCNAVSVRIEGVRFGYRGAESPAVDGLNLYIPAGQSIAIAVSYTHLDVYKRQILLIGRARHLQSIWNARYFRPRLTLI